jgi:peptide/nickel transport system substrate-binding protein
MHWVSFVDQYDPHSPWAEARVRLAANHAINWPAINDAETLGYSLLTGGIIPRRFDFTLPLAPYGYDPKQARQLLTEAGYPNGFDAGECSTDIAYATLVESVVNDLGAVGIRAKARPMERAAIQAAHRDKTIKDLTRQASATSSNAATRIEAFFSSKGGQSFLQDPEIDEWYHRQSTERDRRICSIRFSRRRTTRHASCPSGSRLFCAPQVRASRCQG